MIKEIRQQEPFIHFGFNKQSVNAYVGQEVVIWQDRIYIDDYDFGLISIGSSLVSQSTNKTVLTFDTAGNYTITANISDRDKTFTKQSNVLNINIQEITFGNTEIKWGNTNITFND